MDVDMFVNKRNGTQEPVAFDKILSRLKTILNQYNLKINCTSLAMKVIDQLYNNISTTKIDELSAEQCASLSSTHPDYNVMAGVISISSHQKYKSQFLKPCPIYISFMINIVCITH